MSKSLVKIAFICCTLCLYPAQAFSASVFSFAEIEVPFEVRANGSWVEVIESSDAWERFYIQNAEKYLGPNSEYILLPEFDFDAYTVIAGGLGAGGGDRYLMLESVTTNGATTYVNAVAMRAEGSCSTLTTETYPTVVILMPKPEGTVRVNTREAFYYCN